MASSLSSNEFLLFKEYIRNKCGIEIPPEKSYLIETRLSKLLSDSGADSFGELYRIICSKDTGVYTEKIIDAVTTNETLWFRDKTPWLVLEHIYLPKYIELLRKGFKKTIRIWSSAASTGQEAYSTAMCIDSYLKKNYITDISLSQFEIIATDISHNALELAKKGRYDAITIMRGLDESIKNKYFKQDGSVWEIDQRIKDCVKFFKFNLQNSFGLFSGFDIIFCRYVLIYFAEALTLEVLEKMWRALDKDGVMYLGAYEFYSYADKFFTSNSFENGTYYTKKESGVLGTKEVAL